jgi:hypothetical protein
MVQPAAECELAGSTFQEYRVSAGIAPQKAIRANNDYDKLEPHATLLHLAETCDPHPRKPALSENGALLMPVQKLIQWINRSLRRAHRYVVPCKRITPSPTGIAARQRDDESR